MLRPNAFDVFPVESAAPDPMDSLTQESLTLREAIEQARIDASEDNEWWKRAASGTSYEASQQLPKKPNLFRGTYRLRNGDLVRIDTGDNFPTGAWGYDAKGRRLCWDAMGNNAVNGTFDLMARLKVAA